MIVMPKSAISDDEIHRILTEDGATVPDDFRLVRSDGALTVIRIKNGQAHGYFMSDELADAIVIYLKRRGAQVTDQP